MKNRSGFVSNSSSSSFIIETDPDDIDLVLSGGFNLDSLVDHVWYTNEDFELYLKINWYNLGASQIDRIYKILRVGKIIIVGSFEDDSNLIDIAGCKISGYEIIKQMVDKYPKTLIAYGRI